MRIAIPVFGSRVSPRFDCAMEVLIVDVDKGNVTHRSHESLRMVPSWSRPAYLANRGVDVVLAGGLRHCDYFAMVHAGLKVYGGIVGEVEETLKRYLSGRLSQEDFGFDGPWSESVWKKGCGRNRRGRRWHQK